MDANGRQTEVEFRPPTVREVESPLLQIAATRKGDEEYRRAGDRFAVRDSQGRILTFWVMTVPHVLPGSMATSQYGVITVP